MDPRLTQISSEVNLADRRGSAASWRLARSARRSRARTRSDHGPGESRSWRSLSPSSAR